MKVQSVISLYTCLTWNSAANMDKNLFGDVTFTCFKQLHFSQDRD